MDKRKLCLGGLACGLLNGFFGSGDVVVAVLILERLLKKEAKKAHATAVLIVLPLSVVSIFIYARHGFADWHVILLASIGGAIGGFLGAKILNRIPQKYIHKIFAVILLFASGRMFFS